MIIGGGTNMRALLYHTFFARPVPYESIGFSWQVLSLGKIYLSISFSLEWAGAQPASHKSASISSNLKCREGGEGERGGERERGREGGRGGEERGFLFLCSSVAVHHQWRQRRRRGKAPAPCSLLLLFIRRASECCSLWKSAAPTIDILP